MLILITIIITIACVFLTMIVLIQNPNGGGLGASFGGFSNQMMGVKRTTDFLEKATWTLAVVLIVFSLLTKFFIDSPTTTITDQSQLGGQNAPVTTPTAPPVEDGNTQRVDFGDQQQPAQ